MPYAGGPSQSFSPPIVSHNGGPSSAQYGQALQTFQHQQRLHDLRMRQLQANNSTAPPRNQGGPLNPPPNPAGPMPNYQMGQARSQQAQQMPRPANPEQFVRQIAHWMQQRGLELNPHPTALGRPLNLTQLFSTVMKQGGSKKITATSQWPDIAKLMQIPPEQCLPAAQEIQRYWQTNLSGYEAWMLQARRQHAAISEQMRASQNTSGAETSNAHGQFSPAIPVPPQQHEPPRQPLMPGQPHSHVEYPIPARQVTPQQHESLQPSQNGYLTPQRGQAQGPQPNLYSRAQPISNLPPYAQMQRSEKRITAKQESHGGSIDTSGQHPDMSILPRKTSTSPAQRPLIQPTEKREMHAETHGGYEATSQYWNDVVDDLLKLKPAVPTIQELGVIDIRALTMSLRSGIHAEVRLALDTLALLSHDSDSSSLSLEDCEDLVEVLIECAGDQLELLAENAAEVSDAMLINSYEELARGCRAEILSLQNVHEFGTLDYDLDRSVDRLICITTILRNLSFLPINHRVLADPIVVKFMTTIIRYLGTRNMLLRTYRNTLDFTKDTVIYFSNISQAADLPGKEEALCILHFLLSFAPSPQPNSSDDEDINFAPYNPSVHRYYAPAVDSLAKLLARDDPNRAFYRSIFLNDTASSPSYDLLTRAFGLAIASVPEYGKMNIITALEARKVFLAQGLLAAEILAGLIPGSEHVLARSWLSSQDGFALSLSKIVSVLGPRVPQIPPRHPPTGRMQEPDPQAYGMIAFRGLGVLRKLVEKAKDTDGSSKALPMGILPQRESLLQSLLKGNMDVSLVRQLCNYSGLEN